MSSKHFGKRAISLRATEGLQYPIIMLNLISTFGIISWIHLYNTQVFIELFDNMPTSYEYLRIARGIPLYYLGLLKKVC